MVQRSSVYFSGTRHSERYGEDSDIIWWDYSAESLYLLILGIGKECRNVKPILHFD